MDDGTLLKPVIIETTMISLSMANAYADVVARFSTLSRTEHFNAWPVEAVDDSASRVKTAQQHAARW